MSFGGFGSGGGFGQTNNQQSTGFGGFGATNTNTTGTFALLLTLR
jgi:nuclear pore complex protein Nup98-Nup96